MYREELTEPQRLALSMIRQYIQTHGFPPSYRDLADELDRCPTRAFDHVQALIQKGYLEKDRATARSIRVIEKKV